MLDPLRNKTIQAQHILGAHPLEQSSPETVPVPAILEPGPPHRQRRQPMPTGPCDTSCTAQRIALFIPWWPLTIICFCSCSLPHVLLPASVLVLIGQRPTPFRIDSDPTTPTGDQPGTQQALPPTNKLHRPANPRRAYLRDVAFGSGLGTASPQRLTPLPSLHAQDRPVEARRLVWFLLLLPLPFLPSACSLLCSAVVHSERPGS